MTDETAVYERLAQSPFNGAVGGGDPADVSRRQAHILQQFEPIRVARRILDYGCGIGRTMPGLYAALGRDYVVLDGCDIAGDFIDECRRIHAGMPFRFYKIPGTNDHYDQFATQGDLDRAAPTAGYYDVCYSFSVLTHVDMPGAERILGKVRPLLAPGGHYYFTMFRLDAASVDVINSNRSPMFKFQNGASIDAETFFAADLDRYAFTALSGEVFESVAARNGFEVVQYVAGSWRGVPAENLHDAYLLRKS